MCAGGEKGKDSCVGDSGSGGLNFLHETVKFFCFFFMLASFGALLSYYFSIQHTFFI